MRRSTFALASLLGLAACGGGPSGPPDSDSAGGESQRAGVELALRRTDGTFIDIGELRGRIVVLWLMATFDATSQALLTPLTRIVETEPEIIVIGVAAQPNARLLVDAYEHALSPPFPVTYDPEEHVASGESDLGAFDAIPTVMVLDRTGRVAATHTGFADEPVIRALIARARR